MENWVNLSKNCKEKNIKDTSCPSVQLYISSHPKTMSSAPHKNIFKAGRQFEWNPIPTLIFSVSKMNRYVKLILFLWVALPALINCRQVDEPPNSKDGEEVTWELRNYNGSTLVGSGDPPKLWVRTFPHVKQKKVNERSKKINCRSLAFQCLPRLWGLFINLYTILEYT